MGMQHDDAFTAILTSVRRRSRVMILGRLYMNELFLLWERIYGISAAAKCQPPFSYRACSLKNLRLNNGSYSQYQR